ncbi:MAG: beta-ketoacyl-ACP synthase II [Dehalococcoidales bacterium]|nr:beta-ketoacyl-ACP synthase II [Dehalococcoidales bacterium]MDP6825146.1 beta-ketoacyl-ACP synthase II [Dehalococcoidales bacterium]MDP7415952.1 beta-ketoacyl-ACP synthase II [Dehalococcoidales bacterium]
MVGDSYHRVVITGVGMLTPLGLDAATAWAGLVAGKSGIDYITLFDAEPMETKFAGEVKGFEPTAYMTRKEARHMDRFAQLAVAASRGAVAQARLDINQSNYDDIGVIIGSGIGGLTTLFEQTRVLLEKGPGRVSPFLAPMMISDIAAAQVSIVLGVKGLNLCTTSACSSGSDAIGAAYELIKHGDAQVMLAGGTEAIINPLGITAFNALKAISARNDTPQLASRPFDAGRDGFVISEGACVLVLESLEHAQGREANILGEILSYGATADSHHVTQPIENGGGAARAMQVALRKAAITPAEIDYINAHGTSTPLNDTMETRAIKTVFGDYAYQVPISSTKSMLGHLIGCAGAAEAAICLMVIRESIIPPTINLTNPDPECDLDYVPNVARRAKVTTTLSTSFGFGGHNSVLVLRGYAEA